MKALNKKATQVFCALIDAMKGEEYLKIRNEPYMPLTIEKIGGDIQTPWGIGRQYSLCHYYEQSGDLMQDPEMCFVLVDNRSTVLRLWELVAVIPCTFQQANLGVFEQSVIIENGKLSRFYADKQKDHADFANQWLTNIRRQGFLKAPKN